MTKYKVLDANEAVARVAYKFIELAGIYPITPASPMAEKIDVLSSNGEINFFGNRVKVVEMQSEAGAVATVHGALQSGILASTFTASQGLLLMIPTLYKLSGEMLPGVIHVAARSLSTHSLSIFGDHQDIYSVRSTGVCMLSSSSVEEAYHMAMIAHLSSIKASLPFVNFFDGFRTSHEIDKVKEVDLSRLEPLIDKKALRNFRERALNNENPNERGTAENDDIYFQNTEVRNKYYEDAVDITIDYMKKVGKIVKKDYKPFNYYGSSTAKEVIVAMGSVCECIEETIDKLNDNGYNVGLIKVHLYRPFSIKHLLEVLPSTVEKVAVLDRTKEPGSSGEPLYLDVVNALKDTNIKVIGGRYGLSSKNTTPSMIKAVYDNLNKDMKNNFTIGINDDVTNLSLDIDNNFKLDNHNYQMLIYGYGSDGMVGTSKDILKVIGDATPKYVQGYFQYDSKKSGGVTRSHLRISESPIKSTYYIDNPDFIVVSKDTYIYKYDIIDNLKQNGILLLNTSLSKEDFTKTLPNKVKRLLKDKNIKVYIIDAYKIANSLGLKNKINTCMEVCIFKIMNIYDINKVIKILKENNKLRFASKGDKIVEINNKVIDNSLEYLTTFEVPEEWKDLEYKDNQKLTFNESINLLKGDTLPVSSFIKNKEGIFEGTTTKEEKRNIAEEVPCWISENCIECNQCAFSCPHGVIRPFLLDKKDSKVESIPSLLPKDKEFTIGINYEECTGCGVCTLACPGKLGKKALEMVPNKDKENNFEYLLKNNVNDKYQSNLLTVKNVSFKEPKFEYSGACAGCGETPYAKLMTQMFGDRMVIANATGCTQAWGAALPCVPYTTNEKGFGPAFSNSLFENNAEFSLGMCLAVTQQRERVAGVVKELKENSVDASLSAAIDAWFDAYNDGDKTMEVSENLVKALEAAELTGEQADRKADILNNKEHLSKKSMWMYGGDGWAYDIGFGGLDHVLASGTDVNILVVDTEVYSNTGGQASKATQIGAVAQFAASGKKTKKKDLGLMAMQYGYCYVAQVAMGANPAQLAKVLKEAEEFKGPSLIIAYAPCINHGLVKGMGCAQQEAKEAVAAGYWNLYHYNPDLKKEGKNPFVLDSKEPTLNLRDFLMGEVRFSALTRTFPEEAEKLLAEAELDAKEKYQEYKKLAEG